MDIVSDVRYLTALYEKNVICFDGMMIVHSVLKIMRNEAQWHVSGYS
jgi:hypothetical protein